jgi:hypothetical protein
LPTGHDGCLVCSALIKVSGHKIVGVVHT